MDRTRAAAWAAGIATTLLALHLGYSLRSQTDVRLLAPAAVALLVPIAITSALALPHRTWARAAFAVVHLLLAANAVSSLLFLRAHPELAALLRWHAWVGAALALPLGAAAAWWAAAPTARATLAVRLLALANVGVMLLERLMPPPGPAPSLRSLALFGLWLVPALALVVGLRPVQRDAPTSL